MMRTFSLIALVAAAGFAAAQASPPKASPVSKAAHQKNALKKSLRCPVMPDDKVDVATATKKGLYADYKGRRYFFCCPGCKPAFKANPAKYAKGDSIPLPKKGKKA